MAGARISNRSNKLLIRLDKCLLDKTTLSMSMVLGKHTGVGLISSDNWVSLTASLTRNLTPSCPKSMREVCIVELSIPSFSQVTTISQVEKY